MQAHHRHMDSLGALAPGINFEVDSFSELERPLLTGEENTGQDSNVNDGFALSCDSSSTTSDGDGSGKNDHVSSTVSSNRSEVNGLSPRKQKKNNAFGCMEWLLCGVATNLWSAFVYFSVGFFEIYVMVRHFGPTWYAILLASVFWLAPVTIVFTCGQCCFHIMRCVCSRKCKRSWRETAKHGSMCAAALSAPVSFIAVIFCFFAASYLVLIPPDLHKAPLDPWSNITSVQPGRPKVLPLSKFYQLWLNGNVSRMLRFSSKTAMASKCAAHYAEDFIGPFLKQCICVAPLVHAETLRREDQCSDLLNSRYWVFKQSFIYPNQKCGDSSTCPSVCDENRHANSTGSHMSNVQCVAWYESPTFLIESSRDLADKAVAKAMHTTYNVTHNDSHSKNFVYVKWSKKDVGHREREILAYQFLFIPYLVIAFFITLYPLVAVCCFTKGWFFSGEGVTKTRDKKPNYFHPTASSYDQMDLAYDQRIQDLGALECGSNDEDSENSADSDLVVEFPERKTDRGCLSCCKRPSQQPYVSKAKQWEKGKKNNRPASDAKTAERDHFQYPRLSRESMLSGSDRSLRSNSSIRSPRTPISGLHIPAHNERLVREETQNVTAVARA